MDAGALIASSARKHRIADDDMLHAFNQPLASWELGDGLTMLVGPARNAQLLEVGVVVGDAGPVIVHAMPARSRFLR